MKKVKNTESAQLWTLIYIFLASCNLPRLRNKKREQKRSARGANNSTRAQGEKAENFEKAFKLVKRDDGPREEADNVQAVHKDPGEAAPPPAQVKVSAIGCKSYHFTIKLLKLLY